MGNKKERLKRDPKTEKSKVKSKVPPKENIKRDPKIERSENFVLKPRRRRSRKSSKSKAHASTWACSDYPLNSDL